MFLNYFIGRIDRTGVEPHITFHWFLRVFCGWCWIGHGAWGIITKAGWLPFYAVFGIPEQYAWKLMPLVGTMDVAMGLGILFYPCRANLSWMFFWTVFTALLRPMAGMGWWEFLERGGNYGPPLAFLLLASANGPIGWFDKIEPMKVSAEKLKKPIWVLKVAIAFLLIGHGGFGAFQAKENLIKHWSALGIAADAGFVRIIGWGEIIAGLSVLAIPLRNYMVASISLIVIVYWKIATELLHPIAGRLVDTWEFIERGGDYGGPIALIAMIYILSRTNSSQTTPT